MYWARKNFWLDWFKIISWSKEKLFLLAFMVLFIGGSASAAPPVEEEPNPNCNGGYTMSLTEYDYDEVNDRTTFEYETCCYTSPQTSHWTVQFAGYGTGNIVVTKNVVGDCSEGTSFVVKVQKEGDSQVYSLTFDCNGGTQTLYNLPFGKYTIWEETVTGWQEPVISPSSTITLSGTDCTPSLYEVTIDGIPYPACNGLDYDCYVLAEDPTTHLWGIKFDDYVSNGDCRSFGFTLNGYWAQGEIQAAIKAGSYLPCMVEVDGPVCSSGYAAVTVTNTKCVPPTINCPGPLDLGCNPTQPDCTKAIADFAAANPDLGITPTCDTPGEVVSNGCRRSQSFPLTVDACGTPIPCTITYTWKVDEEAPVLITARRHPFLWAATLSLP